MLLFALMLASQDPCQSQNSAFEMRACTAQQLEGVDRRLATKWKRAIARARFEDRRYTGGGPGDQWTKDLTASQIAWSRYRNAQCLSESYRMRPGNGTAGIELHCLLRLGRARIEELERTFDD